MAIILTILSILITPMISWASINLQGIICSSDIKKNNVVCFCIIKNNIYKEKDTIDKIWKILHIDQDKIAVEVEDIYRHEKYNIHLRN